MGDQLLGTYYFGLDKRKVDVYGCWDGDTARGEFDFYDLYEDGGCINEGNPFYEFPTWAQIADFLPPR